MPDVYHAYHIYVVQVNLDLLNANRDQVAAALRAEGIGINVHYVPVHLHPFYQSQFGTGIGDCPAAEKAYERMITLPIFPDMSEKDTSDVITAVQRVMNRYSK
jgi:perosamine synthetase